MLSKSNRKFFSRRHEPTWVVLLWVDAVVLTVDHREATTDASERFAGLIKFLMAVKCWYRSQAFGMGACFPLLVLINLLDNPQHL